MKIGILTFHRCINYGSYWQARCLADGLRTQGHAVMVLDHASRRVDLAEWRCALQPTLPAKPPVSDRSCYRRKMQRFFRAFRALPLSPRFPLDDPARMPACDVVVVGSDEVWNLSHPWYGGCPLFYGEGIRARRVLSYAASFGNHDTAAGLTPDWSGRLRNFERIAVRDAVSRTMVEHAIGVAPEIVLDPCLQFPVEPAAPREELPAQPYVAVYGHGFSPSFIEGVRQFARRTELPLISIGYRNDWADRQWIDAGPDEFAHAMAGAQAVATNFFHGCVFALRYRKPFVCEESWYRRNKLRCLMAEVGAERHLIAEGTDTGGYAAVLGESPDPNIQNRIDRLRRRSNGYLERALPAEPQPA